MQTFKSFLLKEEEQAKQIKHLTHVEDRVLQTGKPGLTHAIGSLTAASNHIKSGTHSSQLTTKYDGSPSIVYGHHPETGKFFVASKSAFNKTPKINYTEKDIEKNHGHAPGLQNKLTQALKHLPKITPKKGVYQGDMMFSHEDLKHGKKGEVSFNPNPSGLTYTAKGREAEKIKKAKIGVVTHIVYHGKDPKSLTAHHAVDHENFKSNDDVYSIDPRHDTSKVHYSKHDQAEFGKHIAAAKEIQKKAGPQMYEMTAHHQGAGGHLEQYINHTVRTGDKPDHVGFSKFLEKKANDKIEKLKTDKAKNQVKDELSQHLNHIQLNRQHYNNLFKIHHHLQSAKNILVKNLNQHQDFEHHHFGSEAAPEGYVFHHGGETDKFIHRHEFSRRNLLGRDR